MQPGPFDIWLNRISQITQLGLFLLAIFGLYYTVIPLYQKALVDEQLAEKEVRLRELDQQISELYGQSRTRAVRQLVLGAGAYCSGLMLPPRPTPVIDSLVTGEPYKPVPPEKMPPKLEDFVFGSSVSKCFASQTPNFSMASVLRAEDLAALMAKLSEIGAALDVERLEIAATLKSIPQERHHRMAAEFAEKIRKGTQEAEAVQWPQKALTDSNAPQSSDCFRHEGTPR